MRWFNCKTLPFRPILCFLMFYLVLILGRVELAAAQTSRNATTDPSEARALNSIFQKLRVSATDQWNISGELCSGVAIDETPLENINPGIKCNCSNGSVCHITGLRIHELDVVGPLPDELWTLTFLNTLNMDSNYLTGPLPSSISNLTRLQYLSLGTNALSGELPKELGMLTDLRLLAIGTNNFSGPLPSELGNLVKLKEFYFDSCGVSGPIPLTFANLQSLKTVWGSDTRLTGPIPAFIGNWSQLTSLRFQGNSFEGPIPASFSNLTFLTGLRISDLSNGSSSLDFLKDMKSLSTLVLRNNNISGSIPSNFGEYWSLVHLDLSFNNLTGRIPDSLFNRRSLTHLFLGSNKLTGSLPRVKSENLQTIDLSYNELSGSFPSWVGKQSLQLNLVANNFTISNSDSSGLPSGLNCLQRNFPCNRGSPLYSEFAINCGGPQIRSADQIVYERDDETLGPAAYFMTSTSRWAVSNAGLPSGSINTQYTSSSSSQFTDTLDSELFQTARVSAGSLRYYGLGLQNGNYAVTLQFAESEIENSFTGRSLGRRVFDIYVQGNRVLKDFDIKKAAGGRSFTAVRRQFKVPVSENYLEIHLFWAGKGTCCVPAEGIYGPSISAIHAIPLDFIPNVRNNSPSSKKNRTGLIVGIFVPVAIASFLLVFVAYFFIQRRKKQRYIEDEGVYLMESVLTNKFKQASLEELPLYTYQSLANATNNFHSMNKLGKGGFGQVYKGKLLDGQEIAVKRLSKTSCQGIEEFMNEVVLISRLQHRNLVSLLGCCVEREEKMLIYEYMPKGSLDTYLFDSSKQDLLNWRRRALIIEGIGRGLLYLHRDSRLKIIHRDLKASNILLDEELNPKISDFGLARILGGEQDQDKTRRVVGTYGYMSPEYVMVGRFSEKSDVYSYGVVLLEIVTGRRNSSFCHGEDELSLLRYAWKLWNEGDVVKLIDPLVYQPSLEMEILRYVHVGLLCVQELEKDRPNVSALLSMLNSEISELPHPKLPAFTGTLASLESGFSQDIVHSVNNCTVTIIEAR